jgi:hypothetical protein
MSFLFLIYTVKEKICSIEDSTIKIKLSQPNKISQEAPIEGLKSMY